MKKEDPVKKFERLMKENNLRVEIVIQKKKLQDTGVWCDVPALSIEDDNSDKS